MTKRFNAFTLAEVLITLGIIGVVAAMTMPTLINQTNGAQYKAAYKKALSAISQGVTLNVALDGGSFADTVKGTAGTIKPGKVGGAGADKNNDLTGDTVGSILNSRMNIVKTAGASDLGDYSLPDLTYKHTCTAEEAEATGVCNGKNNEEVSLSYAEPDTYLFFNDGIMFAYKAADAEACSKDANVTGNKICTGVIDVNGFKGPNKLVTCDNGTGTTTKPCTVSNPTDVYPVEFYDQTILPASDAAKAVLYGK